MKGAIALDICMLGSVPAVAQYNTTCQNYGNMTNCQTTAPAPGVDWNGYFQRQQQIQQQTNANIYRDMAEAAARRRAQQAQETRDAQAAGARWERQQIGKMVADGQCDRAKNEALSYGDFDLAQQAVALCKPASPPPRRLAAAPVPREDRDAPKIAALISSGNATRLQPMPGL